MYLLRMSEGLPEYLNALVNGDGGCLFEPLGSQRGKLAWRWAERESFVDPRQLGFGQMEVSRARVFGDVLGVGRFGNRKERGPQYQESERDLPRRRVMRGSVLL
jgi:hypothetical protein